MFTELFIDVSELEAPEPFIKITYLLSKLESTNYIRVKHRMQPFPLYDLLHQSGYRFSTLETKNSGYNILIWLSRCKEVADYCQGIK